MPSLTHDLLRDPLHRSMDVLRREGRAGSYVNYQVILGLLVLKRYSDRFESLHDRPSRPDALPVSGSDVLHVPEEARWAKIRGLSRNLVGGLDSAISALCRANQSLAGTLAGFNFKSVAHAFGIPEQADRLLTEVISHLSQLHLSDACLPEPSMLGSACDELIERAIEAAGNKNPDTSAPPSLSRLIVELLDPEAGNRVCDPACGLGSNLISSAQYVAEKSRKRFGAGDLVLTLHGQESNPAACTVCRLNLLLHEVPNPRIEAGDVIVDPKLVKDGKLLCYDRILSIPPLGYKTGDRSALEQDVYGRFHDRQSVRGEFAFVQHAVKSLATNGRAGIVVPNGALFRGASDTVIRQDLLGRDLFEAIIGLPPNLFFGTSMSTVILVLNRNKSSARRGQVLFVNASKDYESHPGRNILRPQDVARIVETYRDWRDDGQYSRIVSNSDIESNGFNMSITRYTERFEYQETPDDIAELLASIVKAEQVRDDAAARMDTLLERLGHGRQSLKR